MPPQLISSGFALSIAQEDIFALVVPRSGLAHREGLVLGNTIGVVDADYTGPCLISAWNRNPLGGASVLIRPGERIAQMLVLPCIRPEFEVVEELSNTTERGPGGFGSTGVKPQD